MTDHIIKLKALTKKIISTNDQKAKSKYRKEATHILADFLTPEAKLFVKSLEKKPQTTKGHYQEYLNMFSNFKGIYRTAFSMACLNSGASIDGVSGAMMLLNQ